MGLPVAVGSPVNSDYDLSATATVYNATPDASNARYLVFDVAVGDGTKNLDGTGGDFTLDVLIGGVAFDGASQTKTVDASTARLRFQTAELLVPANTAARIDITSPNGADIDVDVTVQPYDVVGQADLIDAPNGAAVTAIQNGLATVDNQIVIAAYIDTEIASILNLLEADLYIDTATTPWDLVYIERGTGGLGVGTELLRKALKSTAGANIGDTTTVIGQAVG